MYLAPTLKNHQCGQEMDCVAWLSLRLFCSWIPEVEFVLVEANWAENVKGMVALEGSEYECIQVIQKTAIHATALIAFP